MNIVIIGCNGFIGSNFLNYYSSIGADILCVGRIKPKSFQHKFLELDDFLSLDKKLEYDIWINAAGSGDVQLSLTKPEIDYNANVELVRLLLELKLKISPTGIFVHFSSAAVYGNPIKLPIAENDELNPITPYGISKLQAENYILNQQLPEGKRFYILRPSMIHGPGNKGNLNLLYSFVNKGYPWPLAAFENKRSFLSIDNLCFVTKEIVENDSIPSGVYNIADDQAISTNQLISLISKSQNKNTKSVFLPKKLIYAIAKVGSILHLPINTERLIKLTDNYVISNKKILKSIGKPFPISAENGLVKTLNSFQNVK